MGINKLEDLKWHEHDIAMWVFTLSKFQLWFSVLPKFCDSFSCDADRSYQQIKRNSYFGSTEILNGSELTPCLVSAMSSHAFSDFQMRESLSRFSPFLKTRSSTESLPPFWITPLSLKIWTIPISSGQFFVFFNSSFDSIPVISYHFGRVAIVIAVIACD